MTNIESVPRRSDLLQGERILSGILPTGHITDPDLLAVDGVRGQRQQEHRAAIEALGRARSTGDRLEGDLAQHEVRAAFHRLDQADEDVIAKRENVRPDIARLRAEHDAEEQALDALADDYIAGRRRQLEREAVISALQSLLDTRPGRINRLRAPVGRDSAELDRLVQAFAAFRR